METFLIRVWVPSEPLESASAATLHGLAQHVRSGFTTAFADGEQLCAWLHSTASEQVGAVSSAKAAMEGFAEDSP